MSIDIVPFDTEKNYALFCARMKFLIRVALRDVVMDEYF